MTKVCHVFAKRLNHPLTEINHSLLTVHNIEPVREEFSEVVARMDDGSMHSIGVTELG